MAKSVGKLSKHIGGSKGNILAERIKSTPVEKTMIVPIEIGKNSHKALLADYGGSIFKDSFEFHSSQEGITFLNNTICKVAKEYHIEGVFVGMEATGHYFKKPAESLYMLGYENIFVLNPLTTSQFRKAGLTWSKTDEIDLRAIGQALIGGYGTLYRPEEPIWGDLREICRYRRFQVRRQTALKNKIHTLLDMLLPGVGNLKMFKNPHLWHPASLEFLNKYPSVAAVSRLRPAYIVKFFLRRGRRLSSEDGYHLLDWSRQTFSYESPATSTRQEILKSLTCELRQLSQNISKLEVEILGHLVKLPAVLLLSIYYLGPIRAGEFAGEIAHLEQYPTSRAFIKAAGLDPTRYQSVNRESPHHSISKKGSRTLRYISVMIGNALMIHNDYFSFYAKQLMLRGKSKDCACVATADRFLRVAFQMLKEQKTFQPPNGLGITQNPLEKIRLFLQERDASELIEKYVKQAKKYFK